MTHCPRCEVNYPANDTVGHCSGCHLTFSGMGAFVAHQASGEGRPICRDPSTITKPGPWWVDDRGIWHVGERMSEAKKEKLRNSSGRRSD